MLKGVEFSFLEHDFDRLGCKLVVTEVKCEEMVPVSCKKSDKALIPDLTEIEEDMFNSILIFAE